MTIIYSDTFKNLQTLSTTHTSSQTSSSSANTFITLSGSEISYEPYSGASKVIYEISFYCEKINTYTFLVAHLESADIGNTNWSEINSKFRRNFGDYVYSSQSRRWYTTLKFIVPTWSGQKQLRLRIAHPGNNNETVFHQMSEWDGVGSVTNKFCDTNLLVYSI